MNSNQVFIKLKLKIKEAVQSIEYKFDFTNPDENKKIILDVFSNKYSKVGIDSIARAIQEKIRKLAVYDYESYDTDIHNTCNSCDEDFLKAKMDRENDKCFSVSDLRILERNLYLSHYLLNEDVLPYAIISNLNRFLPNGNFYECEEDSLNTFMSLAIDLYLVKRYPPFGENVKLIEAVKYFKLMHSRDFEIDMDKFTLTESANKEIFNKIEEKIKALGAYKTLFFIFNILENMEKEFDRYPLYKNKGINKSDTPIPYQLLIHIACKYMKFSRQQQLSLADKSKFLEILNLGRIYIDLLEVYDANIFSEMISDVKELPAIIQSNIVLENLCFPAQYTPRYISFLVKELYIPIAKDIEGCPQFYKTESFFMIFNKILSYPPNSIINVKEFGKSLTIKNSIILDFFNHFSQNINVINDNYIMISSESNLYNYPFIKIDENNFYFLSTQFCGYAFCKVIYQTLQSNYNGNKKLTIEFGDQLELVVKNLMKEKKYDFKDGFYGNGKNKSQYKGECDLVLDSEDKIVFVEIKNSGLSSKFELLDDVNTLNELSKNALFAHKQILKHRLHLLENNNKINLYEEQECSNVKFTLDINNKRAYSIALCGAEVYFFTTGHIPNLLIQSLSYVHYSEVNGDNYKLDSINKLADDMNKLVKEYIKMSPSSNVRNIFFSSTIKSLQDFWITLQDSENLSNFICNITHDTTMQTYDANYYSSLKMNIGLKNHKSNKDN